MGWNWEGIAKPLAKLGEGSVMPKYDLGVGRHASWTVIKLSTPARVVLLVAPCNGQSL